jgi:hypothetical protein
MVPANPVRIIAGYIVRAYHSEMERTCKEFPSADFVVRQEPDDQEDEEEDNGSEKDEHGDEGYSE